MDTLFNPWVSSIKPQGSQSVPAPKVRVGNRILRRTGLLFLLAELIVSQNLRKQIQGRVLLQFCAVTNASQSVSS